MASIIQPSDFFGDISLAQIGQVSVQVDVQAYIDKFENEYLLKMLGYETKLRLEAGTLDDVKNGKEYRSRFEPNVLIKWRGLVIKDKASPIASYIYCKYIQDQWSRTTGVGEKKLKAQNATVASPNSKLISQWNWMVERNRELMDFLLSNQTTYPEFYNYYMSSFWTVSGFELTIATHGVF